MENAKHLSNIYLKDAELIYKSLEQIYFIQQFGCNFFFIKLFFLQFCEKKLVVPRLNYFSRNKAQCKINEKEGWFDLSYIEECVQKFSQQFVGNLLKKFPQKVLHNV